jgi:GrpB-like predicted nucleotidyltransferase (UPF0157 family)
MKIQLTDYDPAWTDIFEKEKDRLKKILPDNSTIEHIGSTSIINLCAKPIIDILCGLENFAHADSFIDVIVRLNYEYIDKYTTLIPERRFFKKYTDHKFHIHLVQTNGDWWKRHILFRDYLRTNIDAKNEYALLKRQLEKREWADGNEYADAKTEFIKTIEQKAKQSNNT